MKEFSFSRKLQFWERSTFSSVTTFVYFYYTKFQVKIAAKREWMRILWHFGHETRESLSYHETSWTTPRISCPCGCLLHPFDGRCLKNHKVPWAMQLILGDGRSEATAIAEVTCGGWRGFFDRKKTRQLETGWPTCYWNPTLENNRYEINSSHRSRIQASCTIPFFFDKKSPAICHPLRKISQSSERASNGSCPKTFPANQPPIAGNPVQKRSTHEKNCPRNQK